MISQERITAELSDIFFPTTLLTALWFHHALCWSQLHLVKLPPPHNVRIQACRVRPPATHSCVHRSQQQQRKAERTRSHRSMANSRRTVIFIKSLGALSLLLNAQPACWKNIDGDTRDLRAWHNAGTLLTVSAWHWKKALFLSHCGMWLWWGWCLLGNFTTFAKVILYSRFICFLDLQKG